MEVMYKKECSQTKSLKKELQFQKHLQEEGQEAKEEAVRLRKKLETLSNVQKVIQGEVGTSL